MKIMMDMKIEDACYGVINGFLADVYGQVVVVVCYPPFLLQVKVTNT
jgi:hypothetical protein